MNVTQKALWSGALKSAVGALTGVILANFVDVPQTLFSWPWFRHVLIAAGVVVLVTEARFWNQWAHSGATPAPIQQSLADAKQANVQAGVAIAKAQTEAPKP
jgi:H+/Cl- antiporter ClcA